MNWEIYKPLRKGIMVPYKKGEFKAIKPNINMENLYDWVINYNPYTKTWRAAKRENYNLLFSAVNSPLVIKTNDIDVLIDILVRTDGDTTKLNYIREI